MPTTADWRIPRSTPEAPVVRQARLAARFLFLRRAYGATHGELAEACGRSENWVLVALSHTGLRRWVDVSGPLNQLETGVSALETKYGVSK